MEALIEKTTKSDQLVASTSVELITESGNKVLQKKQNVVRLRIQDSNEVVTIPLKAFMLLKSILSNMAEGKSVALIPSDSEVTTKQAAEMLNVSRPHIVKLLEKGEIPFKKVGSHRRIQLKDLLAYDDKIKKDRRKKLDFLAKEAQKLNLGYE
jgi:excisionase family DNA binding protein